LPTYRYLCSQGHETQEWHSIHEDIVRTMPCGECSRIAKFAVASPAIAADALPNKRHGVRAIDAKDKQLEKDLVAYRALRADGLQPKGIDGSHKLEALANSPLEVEMGRRLGKEKDVRRAQEVTSELMGQDVTKVGSEVGAAKRGES